MIPDAAVEAAAQLLAEESPEDWSGEQWANEKIHDSFRKPWRDQARRILEAAAPHMLSHEREQTRLAHVDAVVNAETVDRLERELVEAKASALEEAADNWSDWDALEAPEDWLRARANTYRTRT